MPFSFKEPCRLNGSCSPHSCRRDHLAEVRIGYFSPGKHACPAGLHPIVNLQVAQLIHIQLAFEHFGVRGMADENENAISLK